MKKFFSKFYAVVKVFTFLAIFGVGFYSGMYFITSSYDPANQKEIMSKAITSAFANTEKQPIIMIVPKYSLLEKSKRLVGMNVPEREIIKISTAASTRVLFEEEIKPSLFTAALGATGKAAGKAWNGTKAGASQAWAGSKASAEWTLEKIKFWN